MMWFMRVKKVIFSGICKCLNTLFYPLAVDTFSIPTHVTY